MTFGNVYTGQIIGPFNAEEELIDIIKKDAAIDVKYVKHIGVQTDIGSIILINNMEFEIGKTGIYEIGNTEITSIKFKDDKNINTIIDYVIE